MASIRPRFRKDGSEYFSVVYRHDGKQSSISFSDFGAAKKFADLANKFGPENALSTLKENASTVTSMTVEQWLNRHIENLTGVDPNTRTKYRAYVRNDLSPVLGELPLTALSAEHIAHWINLDGRSRTRTARTPALRPCPEQVYVPGRCAQRGCCRRTDPVQPVPGDPPAPRRRGTRDALPDP